MAGIVGKRLTYQKTRRRIGDTACGQKDGSTMPKGKTGPTPETVVAQRKRFIETARELGADETGEAFERMFIKVVPPKQPGQKATSATEEFDRFTDLCYLKCTTARRFGPERAAAPCPLWKGMGGRVKSGSRTSPAPGCRPLRGCG